MGYKKVKLKDIYTIKKGNKVNLEEEIKKGIIRYIQIGDLRNNKNLKYCIPIDKYVIAKKDDIIIAWDGANAGTSNYGLEGAIGSTLATLKPKNVEFYTPYIGKFVKSKFSYLRNRCTGATIPHLNRKVLENLEIPLSPMDIQIKIANALDKAQELVDNRKAQIEKYEKLLQSVFLDMFGDPVTNPRGWEKEILGDLSKITSGGTPSRSKPEYFKGNIPWITTVSLGSKYINSSNAIEYITNEAVKNSTTKIIPSNSILLGTRVGVGKASINKNEICTNQDILSLTQISPKLELEFLLFIFKQYETYFNSQKRGATIKGITSKVVKELDIILPPLKLQNKFASIVEKVESEKKICKDSLRQIENNFNSIMQRAFRGELF